MAQKRAFEVCEQIHFDGMQYRRDIGYRAIAPKRPCPDKRQRSAKPAGYPSPKPADRP
jgi:hypothetical protein